MNKFKRIWACLDHFNTTPALRGHPSTEGNWGLLLRILI